MVARADPKTPTLSAPCCSTMRRSASAVNEIASSQETCFHCSGHSNHRLGHAILGTDKIEGITSLHTKVAAADWGIGHGLDHDDLAIHACPRSFRIRSRSRRRWFSSSWSQSPGIERSCPPAPRWGTCPRRHRSSHRNFPAKWFLNPGESSWHRRDSRSARQIALELPRRCARSGNRKCTETCPHECRDSIRQRVRVRCCPSILLQVHRRGGVGGTLCPGIDADPQRDTAEPKAEEAIVATPRLRRMSVDGHSVSSLCVAGDHRVWSAVHPYNA